MKNEIDSGDKATPPWEGHKLAARIALWLTPPIPTCGRVIGASPRLGWPRRWRFVTRRPDGLLHFETSSQLHVAPLNGDAPPGAFLGEADCNHLRRVGSLGLLQGTETRSCEASCCIPH